MVVTEVCGSMNSCVTKIKYIMHKVQDYSVLYNHAVQQVICEGLHITHIWKALS